MTKSKWSATALLIVVFVLGALSGGAAAGLAERSTGEERPARRGMVQHMTEVLDLTSEQQDSVRAILERHKEAFRTMRTQIGEEIRAQLTPDQLERYETWSETYRGQRRHGGKMRDSMQRRHQ